MHYRKDFDEPRHGRWIADEICCTKIPGADGSEREANRKTACLLSLAGMFCAAAIRGNIMCRLLGLRDILGRKRAAFRARR